MCNANVTCVERLKELPLHDMIVVTGAGPSSPGCCITMELVQAVAAACHIAVPEELTRVDQFFQSAHDANTDQYYATVRDKFSPPFTADPKVYGSLVAVGFRAYITFDYDDLLPQAMLRSRGKLDGQFTYYPQPTMFRPYDLHSQRIVAVHGFADVTQPDWERKLVLKTADYRSGYTVDRNKDGTGGLLGWWCQILTEASCLFVGTSLSEPGVASAINYLLEDNNTRFQQQKHVCMVPLRLESPKNEAPPTFDPLFDAIQCVPYHPEGPRHRGLLRVWQEITGIRDSEIPVRREIVPELKLDETKI